MSAGTMHLYISMSLTDCNACAYRHTAFIKLTMKYAVSLYMCT